MSDFKFSCPKCGQHIVCDTSNTGMQIPCPACQAVLTVPAAPAAVSAPGAPGKLSIRAVAHHAAPTPPPPGSANAPAKPTWGAKPAPAPVAKKFPVAMVSVIVAVILVLAVGWFGFGAPYLKKKADEKQQAEQAEAARVAAEAKAKADAAARAKRAQAEWNLDLADARFPERPASGKVHGENFTPDAFALQNGFLTLRQTSGSTRQLQIPVPLKPGEKIGGKTIHISAADAGAVPHIVMNWKEESPKPPGTQTFTKGYALKLEFSDIADGSLPGKIYLSLPDDAQSFVAGEFEIGARKAGAVRPKRPRPGAPGAPPPK